MGRVTRERTGQERERMEIRFRRGTVIAPAVVPMSGKETEQPKGRPRD